MVFIPLRLQKTAKMAQLSLFREQFNTLKNEDIRNQVRFNTQT